MAPTADGNVLIYDEQICNRNSKDNWRHIGEAYDGKVKLNWKQKGSDYPMRPHLFSDGSMRFICLTAALLQPDPPSTMIIDEPELGMHNG